MKKLKLIALFIITIFYLLPYSYIGMIVDFKSRNMVGYLIMLILPICLTIMCIKFNLAYLIIIGNLLSYFSSYYFIETMNNMNNQRWDVYFKIITPHGLSNLLHIIICILQIITYVVYKKTYHTSYKES